MRFQVVNRSENIVLKRGVVEISLARTSSAAESTKVNCQDLESSGRPGAGLIFPAFLAEILWGETPALRAHSAERSFCCAGNEKGPEVSSCD